jgi:TonB family protein
MSENGRAADNMPQTIGRYQVAEGVGFGAMGAVYKAFDPLIKRTLAIKTIRLDIPRQSPQYKSFIDRFYHEARISGTLSHPNIVTLFDIGEENGLPYLAMEFVEGETIASLLERGVRFKPEKVIGLVSQVASAIDYAHSRGVIHRDIKPSNLILSEGERVKVTDFGIAKLIDAEMTQSGTLLGTPSYMSPEQAMGEKLDGRSDIFSLGVCAFEMLAGEQPFPGNNVTSILYKLVHVEPIQPANLEMNGLVPQKWHEVFGKVLSKKPDERYQTATEFVQDLEYCLGSWFGAVADMTLAEGVPETIVGVPAPPAARKTGPQAPVASNDETTVMPVLPERPPMEATVAMTAADVDARGGAAPPTTTMVETSPVPPEMEGTVVMPVPAAALAGEGTVVMAAPVVPPASSAAGEGTVMMAAPPAPPPAPEMEGTVVMESPVRAASAPSSDADGTVVMQAPRAPVAESTVLMSAPPAPRPPAPMAPSAGGAGAAMEGTVVMSASAMAPPPPPLPEGRSALAPFADEPASAASAPQAGAPRSSGPIPMPPKPTATAAMPPIEPPRKKSAAPLAIAGGGAGLLVLAVLVGGVYWFVKSRRVEVDQVATPAPPSITQAAVTPTPPPPAVVVKGKLHVESEPAGATVTLNGEARGVTPLDVTDLFLGNHEVKVELRSFEPVTRTIVLSEEAPDSELKLALLKAAPAMGVAEVISTPSGALVKIDGSGVGQTPLMNHSLKAGKHQVEVVKEGYEPWTESITVGNKRKARVDAQLRAIAKPTPVPVVADVPDPNKTYEQGDVDTPPRQVTSSSVSYPKDAPKLKSGQSVSVGGTFVVTTNGDVVEIQIRESGGAAVDSAVMAALAKRKYTPAVKKGIKVKVRVPFRQTFQAS